MKTLTVFTPTYNRAHTLERLYRSLCAQTCKDFEWLVIDDGSTDGTANLVQGFAKEGLVSVRYIYKENGGLYTGYNTAYANIDTELNVCIDSDDAMPEDAVERILKTWWEKGSDRYAGLIGLDCYMDSREPIGGRFPVAMTECWFMDLYAKRIHRGDTKQVMRTALMKEVAPQVGFPGEKNFNPIYMLLQVCDKYPLLVLDEPLCLVEYQQGDSMSRNIWKQYLDSPRSFAKMRRLEMSLLHNTWWNRYRSAVHYVAECRMAKDGDWIRNAHDKALILFAWVPGLCLSYFIRWKA
ncbi:MAG: glycosyltransferase family 2 protein [Bacteroidales bacterium]|nr:glycosyltransferase family 2 protein [Bacteroidales bacterium]